MYYISGHSLVVKLQPSKLIMRVRFSLSALILNKNLKMKSSYNKDRQIH